MTTVPDRFERDYGCTEAEWLRWMPEAIAPQRWRREGSAALQVDFDDGTLDLQWVPLPPRVIALLRLPRLHVRFVFDGVAPNAREVFLRRFDLSLRRGGG